MDASILNFATSLHRAPLLYHFSRHWANVLETQARQYHQLPVLQAQSYASTTGMLEAILHHVIIRLRMTNCVAHELDQDQLLRSQSSAHPAYLQFFRRTWHDRLLRDALARLALEFGHASNVASETLDHTVQLASGIVATSREIVADGRAEVDALRRLRHVPLLLECLCQLASCGFKDLDRAIHALERGLNDLEMQTDNVALVSWHPLFILATLSAARPG